MRYSLVILEGVRQLSAPVLAGLQEALKQGVSVVWIPSEGPLDPQINQGLLGGMMSPYQSAAQLTLDEPKAQDVFFQGIFDGSPRGQTTWQLPQVQATWRWTAPSETLVQLRDGSPILQRRRQANQGGLYVWSTSFQKDRGNLGEHALFPALFLKIALESASIKPLAYRLDQPRTSIFWPSLGNQPTIRLEGPGGEFTPAQAWQGGTWSFSWPTSQELSPGQTLQAGIYRLLVVKQAKGKVILHTDDSWKSQLANDAQGRPLWWYFMLLALLCAVAEGLLGRYWHQKG